MLTKKKQKFILSLTASVLFVLFFLGDTSAESTRSFNSLWDKGHIVFFAISSYLFINHNTFVAKKSFKIQFICLLFLTILIGTLIELLQLNFNRTFSIRDIQTNIIGSFTGFFLFSSSRRLIGKYALKTVQLLIIILLILEIIPLGKSLWDEWNAKRIFPILANFESPFEVSRWTGSADFKIVKDIKKEENNFLKIELGTTQYSGVTLKYFPRNWHGYTSLNFTFFNPSSKNLKITCRIEDFHHTVSDAQSFNDRYNHSYIVKPGQNTFSVKFEDIVNAPKTRSMNLKKISRVGFFVIRQATKNIVYVDDIMLR